MAHQFSAVLSSNKSDSPHLKTPSHDSIIPAHGDLSHRAAVAAIRDSTILMAVGGSE